MKHSVCVIDDSIPTGGDTDFIDDTKILGKSTLKYLLGNEIWPDDNVKSLISTIVQDDSHWHLTAFRNPSFFFNHVQDNILTPEIFIFDWDYDGQSEDSEEHLMTLLKSTYSLIYVYTKADMEDAVSAIIASDRFADFRHRLSVIKKEDNSVDRLLAEANEKYEKNFSYRFGKELKMRAIKGIDEILIEISKLSLHDFMALFGSKKGNKYSIPTVELVSIISEKFKHQLLSRKFPEETVSLTTESVQNDENLTRKIWSYRLYHCPEDNIVRKGDIIRTHKNGGDTLFLVLSSDCHMDNFWKKNFGFVTLIPLHKLIAENENIRNRFEANNANKLNQFKPTSLTNSQIAGMTILPGIKDKDGSFSDYLLNAKEVFSKKIPLPTGNGIDKFNLPLIYNHWKGYDWKNRSRVSEPFLSPLIQFILEHITGYGSPDFPEALRTQIKKSFDDARN